mgnify:CR=1 FL=1
MAGLIQQQMAPQGAQPTPPQGGEGGQPAGGEQEMYNALVEAMLGYLYDAGMENVERKLAAEENPVMAMASAMSYIMLASIGTLHDQGRSVPPQVMAQAGMELADNIGQVADAMGLVSIEDELAIEMAYFIALDMLAKQVPDNPPGTQEQYQVIADTLRNERLAMMDPNDLPPEIREELMAAEQAPAQQPAQDPMMEQEGY